MTHEEKLHIDLLWYQAMEDCVKEASVRYAFAALVRADEREQCAKVCDDLQRSYWNSTRVMDEPDAYDCAAAIRARSNP